MKITSLEFCNVISNPLKIIGGNAPVIRSINQPFFPFSMTMMFPSAFSNESESNAGGPGVMITSSSSSSSMAAPPEN
ncbi:hypothetical protein FRE64_05005 [Euhalothece natronophila Z-M001]|uniref:Uncharacterized protein n=1 Tax=Euhalothece natronophila Z-M001 TaxID=522448 RepID=A0A5B8NLD9_9CHRO|nr:hypothetical protein [Euhalothece natronophila]QDZ39341.1 hypothetical protein FRE64_05005 [Euhalothece natronophila Z-M001]